MSPGAKSILRRFLPPSVLALARRLRGLGRSGPLTSGAIMYASTAPEPPEWEAVPNTDEVWNAHAGWSHESIAQQQRERWPGFLASLEDNRPLGWRETKPGEAIDINTHNTLITFGYVLGLAAAGRNSVSLLDWGGGLGQYGRYATLLQPGLTIDYTVKDLPSLCQAGRELNPHARFVDDEDQALLRQYDLVFASSSLQYTRELYPLVGRLCDAAERYLFITRTPFVETHDDFVVVQRPHRYGYMTEYPAWFINRRRFMDFVAAKGFALQREFMLGERPYVPNAPEHCVYCGFLLKRRAMV